MENASKALILAGGVLIGIIILSVLVFMFRSSADFAREYGDSTENIEINRFNSKLLAYCNKTRFVNDKEENVYYTLHDINSLLNLAIDYNMKVRDTRVEICIIDKKNNEHWYTGKGNTKVNFQDAEDVKDSKFNKQKALILKELNLDSDIKLKESDERLFVYQSHIYDDVTKLIKQVKFKEK